MSGGIHDGLMRTQSITRFPISSDTENNASRRTAMEFLRIAQKRLELLTSLQVNNASDAVIERIRSELSESPGSLPDSFTVENPDKELLHGPDSGSETYEVSLEQ